VNGDVPRITHERSEGAVIVRVEGDVDTAHAEKIGDEIAGLVGNEEFGVALDLSRTRYLDSAGIRMVFQLGDSLQGRGQALCLVVERDQPMREALTLFEIERVVPLVESVAEAIDHIDGAKRAEPPTDDGADA
jgi:anti-anti-sigma factor